MLRERFSWKNPQHIEETLGSEILSYHTELLPPRLRHERNERVSLRFLNWFYTRHKPVSEEEESLLFDVFTEASDETRRALAAHLAEKCGPEKAIERMELINEEAKKAIELTKKGGLKPRAYHHVHTAFTLIQGIRHTLIHELALLEGEKK